MYVYIFTKKKTKQRMLHLLAIHAYLYCMEGCSLEDSWKILKHFAQDSVTFHIVTLPIITLPIITLPIIKLAIFKFPIKLHFL